MASKKELQALITLAGKVDPSLQKALANTTKSTKGLSDSMQQSAKHASRLGDIIKGTFIGSLASNGVMRIASSISAIGSEALSTASSLIEVQNVVDTTYGNSASQIDAWSKTTLKAYGITELQAKEWAGSMGAMLKSSGIAQDDMITMSTELASLAGDFASFYNLDHDEAWTKIRSGISGETEPLKQLGINMSVANLESYAMAKGIKKAFKDMTQSEQTLLRYNYLLGMSEDAQGDFSRTLETSWENQKRLLKNSIMDKAASALSRFIPLFTDLTAKANEFVSNIDMDAVAISIENGFKLAGDAVRWLSDNMSWLMPVAGGLLGTVGAFMIINSIVSAFQTWKLATEGMTIAQALLNTTMLASPITWVAIGIGALIAVGIALWKNWDTIKIKAEELKQSFYDKFGPLIDWWTNIWTSAQNVAKGAVNGVINLINKIPGINIPTLSIEEKERRPPTKSIPQFALGGIATQASIFGEAGPEMAIPLKRNSRSYELLGQTAKLLGVNLAPQVLSNPIVDDTLAKDNLSNNQKLNTYPLRKEQAEKSKNSNAPQIIIQINGGNQQEVKTTVLSVLDEYFGDEGRLSFG